jgi:SpoVK/Ycf46/Vps4 family AAA+-type ATPase
LVGGLARRFRLTEAAIDATVARAVRQAAWDGRPVTAGDLWAAARRQPDHDLERLATLVTPVWTLDDLVVSPQVRAQLTELLAHVAYQDEVLDGWGFRRRLPRGQGVAALFSGPPGTGKTMAAEAVAHALHQDLYRVDLAAVVSKWLGETEKNLAAAFDEAERSGAVLLFDEADALFGKRTEVHDARDRYANLEVNYLLQRVEAFTGLVILATNRKSSLDEAFTRRLRFMVGFEMPSPADRRRLWPRSFPPEARRDDLDWDALAAGELPGASIQAVALSAAFLAASDGGCITRAHVEAALGREYEKLGRAFPGLPAGGRS